MRTHHSEGSDPHPHSFFVPTRFQSHEADPKQGIDFSGEWIDTFSSPHVTDAAFHYPACESADPEKLDMPVLLGPLGLHPSVLTQLVK